MAGEFFPEPWICADEYPSHARARGSRANTPVSNFPGFFFVSPHVVPLYLRGWTQDAWSGDRITGPKTIQVTQPFERIPLWHRVGGVVVTTSNPGLRVYDQDWSELTLEAFPATNGSSRVTRYLFDRDVQQSRTEITLSTDEQGQLDLWIGAADNGQSRAWTVRLHLAPGQQLVSAQLDQGRRVTVNQFAPVDEVEAPSFFPFGGKGTRPAPRAGRVAELRLEPRAGPQHVRARLV